MSGFIEGACRSQATLFPDRLDDYISAENPVQVIDVFIVSLDLSKLEFKTIPAIIPAVPLITPLRCSSCSFVYICRANQLLLYRCTSLEKGLMLKRYWVSDATCRACRSKPQCSNSKQPRKTTRCQHQGQIDQMDQLMSSMPDSMLIRKQTVEHSFGTIKSWMGATHLLTKRLQNVSTEMSLHLLAYNLRRMMSILRPGNLIAAMRV